MGSRIAMGFVVCAAFAAPAFAQPKPPAGQTKTMPLPPPVNADVKQGLDLYAAGDFTAAVPVLERAHEAEPANFEVHFALAQALRKTGQCDKALPHYKALVDTAPEPAKADEVHAAMAECPVAVVTPPPPMPAPTPPPVTVVVHDSSISTTNVLMIGGAGAGLAAALCLFMAARDASNDAAAAALYKDYEDISSRSTKLYIASGFTAAAGIALAVTAYIGIKASKEHSTGVAIAPHANGGTIVLEGSW